MGCEILTIIWAVGSVVTLIVASYAYYLARSTRKRIDEANRLLRERSHRAGEGNHK